MPTGKKETHTKAQVTEIARMYREGKSLSEIAALTKVGHGSLYRVLHKAKVPLRGRLPAASAKPKVSEPEVSAEVEVAAPKSAKVSALKAKLKDAMDLNAKLKILIVEMMLDKKR